MDNSTQEAAIRPESEAASARPANSQPGAEAKPPAGSLALKAGVWYVVSSVMVKAISIITTPLFTRMLSTSEYGTVQTFTSWHGLLLPFFTLNLTYSIGRAKLDFPGRLDEYIGSMQTLATLWSALLTLIALACLEPVAALLDLTRFQTVLLLAYLLFQIAILMQQNGYRYTYQYKQNIAIAWYSAVVSSLLSIALILILKEKRDDLRIIGFVAPTAALSVFLWGKSIRSRSVCIRREYWAHGLKLALPLILHNVSLHILSQSDRIFITKIWGKTDTAYYSLAYSVGALLTIVTSAIAQGWLPWFHDTYFAKQFGLIKKNVKPVVILGCYIGLACTALAPEAVLLLGGAKYAASVPCVAPIVLGVVCQYIYTNYVNIEMHLKKTLFISIGTICAALFNILTNAVFIPRYGFIAAAYTTFASYCLLMLIHFFLTRKLLHVKLFDDLFMFASLAVTGLLTGVILFTYRYPPLRYALLAVGFASFLFFFRSYIKDWIRKLPFFRQKQEP